MRKFMLTSVLTLFILSGVFAGTATGDIVINVEGKVNGSPGVFGDGADVEIFLTAGDYTLTLVNNVIGHLSYHDQAEFTGWSFHTPGNWSTNYQFNFDDLDPNNNTRSSPPYAGPDELNGGRYSVLGSALEAFDDAAALDQLTLNVHIPFDQTVGFYFADNGLTDNGGGVSVLIRQATIPEPTTVGLLGVFGAGLILLRRRRRPTLCPESAGR